MFKFVALVSDQGHLYALTEDGTVYQLLSPTSANAEWVRIVGSPSPTGEKTITW